LADLQPVELAPKLPNFTSQKSQETCHCIYHQVVVLAGLALVADVRRWMTAPAGLRRQRGARLLRISEELCMSSFFLSQLMFNLTLSPSDPSGALNFAGKAVLHAQGVDFTNGSSFAINMTQLQLEEELGRGNYGTVKKVLHKPTKVHMAMKASVFISFPAPTISFPHRRSVLN
jgi:hypothetical protein